MADHAHEHAHDDDEHDHPNVVFVESHVDDAVLAELRVLHPALADALVLCRRFGELSDDEKRLLAEAQRHVESFELWTPGYHAPGDRCGACGASVAPLFTDRFGDARSESEGEDASQRVRATKPLAYAAFVADVPVHARAQCIQDIMPKLGRRAPQQLDKLRRELTTSRERPSARLTQFFRHDVLTHPPFGIEDWANSVAEANAGKLDRASARDIERLLSFVHQKLFH